MGYAMGLIERVGRAVALGDAEMTRASVELAARQILERESPLRIDSTARSVADGLVGLGPIQPLVDEEGISDILVNGLDPVWVDRGAGLEVSSVAFRSAAQLVATIERAVAPLGLRVDRMAPTVDARLPDGSRLHAVVAPAAVDGPLLAIRRFTQRVSTLDDLVESGFASRREIETLGEAVAAHKTLVISGGTGAGKTTLLNLLASRIAPTERVVTIEDAAELNLPGHVVRLEARPDNAEGVGGITIRQLLRSALRLRPDRIVVGEVRGAEALDLISALNTGHRGSMTTVHANSPREALWRLETLALMEGHASESAVQRQLHAAVDLVVQIGRTQSHRRIEEILSMTDLGGPN